MERFRYMDKVATLTLKTEACVGCGSCVDVCPHRILQLRDKQIEITDFDACMECGACALNCPTDALAVTPGVGCAAYVIGAWLEKFTGRKLSSGCC